VHVSVTLFPELEQREAEASTLAKVASAAAVARLREREADFTPRFVCRALLERVFKGCVQVRGGAALIERLAGQSKEPSIWPAVGRADVSTRIGEAAANWQGPIIETGDQTRVIRVLDICAGAGVWASEVRRIAEMMGFEVLITAVDYEPDERPWLVRHADRVIIGDWHEALGMVQDEHGVWVWSGDRVEFDIIVGNPAFSQARAATRPEWPEASGPPKKEGGQPTVTKAEARIRKQLTNAMIEAGEYPARAEYDTANSMPALCLQCAPVVCLYTTQQCYLKTSSGWLTWLDYPGALAFNVPSSIGHRGRSGGMDDKPYGVTVWTREHQRGEPTLTFMIDPVDDRGYDLRPGTEPDEWLEEQGNPWLREPVE
jgi:hypothetical protein